MIDDARTCGLEFFSEQLEMVERRGASRALRGAGGFPCLAFELDPETLLEIECRARQRGVKPFEMCLILLREALAAPRQQGLD